MAYTALNQKLFVITGCSKGIGKATALALLNENAIVVGWGLNKPEIKHPCFHFIATDVADLNQVEHAYQATKALYPDLPIFGLLNNAGLGHFGSIDKLNIDSWHHMFNVNVHGLMYVTKTIVPDMKAAKAGHILNISSIAGLNGIVDGSGYAATKWAVRGISQSLYQELRVWGIKVSCVFPGSVQTNFFDNVAGVTANENMMQPEDVALIIVDCFKTHWNLLPVELEIRPLMPKGRN